MTSSSIEPVHVTSFSSAGMRERADLQRLLRANIGIVSPDTLIIAEEFGSWDSSSRRIDLLGIDKDANLVVIELKRDETGAHMELQALRYAAMIARMTFEQAQGAYHAYLSRVHAAAVPGEIDPRPEPTREDARSSLLAFLEWEEPDESSFAQEVRIVLVSADFSRELTTSVMWLNERDLDIRCVQMQPYRLGDQLLLQVEQVIPLREAGEYQIQVREKARQERAASTSTKDWTRFDLSIGQLRFQRLPKRRLIYQIIRHLVLEHAVDAASLEQVLVHSRPWLDADGVLDAASFRDELTRTAAAEGTRVDLDRFLCGDDELLVMGGRTYAITKMWGTNTLPSIEAIQKRFPQVSFEFAPSEGF